VLLPDTDQSFFDRAFAPPIPFDDGCLEPMAGGFVYLAVVLDWFSRGLPAWRLSATSTPQPPCR
jgi:hypothetical protein